MGRPYLDGEAEAAAAAAAAAEREKKKKKKKNMAITLSSSDFNEIEFTEYNPTPYKGGYDIAQTYGNPLPPSDAICYPRSQISGDPDEIVPVSAAAAAYDDDDDKYEKRLQDGIGNNEGEEEEEEEEQQQQQRPIYEGGGNWDGIPVRCCDLGWGNIFSYDDHRFYGDGYGDEYGYCKGTVGVEGELFGDSDGDYYRGSGSETYQNYGVPDPELGIMRCMDALEDLCNGVFFVEQQGRHCSNDQIGQNPWKETADYLFGNSNSFEETHYDPSCYDQCSDFFQHDSSSWNHQSNHYKFQSQSHHYEAYPHKTDSAAQIGSALYHHRQYKH
ncbi:hypothetical protein H6P81_003081 [Aristolochia fimbriata]|uniref:Uncharacterized protein n=1 Tax=Aristolochia fimbriata TaxID=158543 RepID=A0AAV7FBS8_ARIFI|nr:hypothetical protein H6P81_003081 [Aristolochia fimbriata]